MPLKFIYIGLLLVLLSFSSCEKETYSSFTPNSSNAFNDTTWQENTAINAIEFKELSTLPLIDTFNSSVATTFTLNDSISVYIPANGCLNANKQPFTTATNIIIKASFFATNDALIGNGISTNSYLQLVNLLCHFKVELKTTTGEAVFWDETKNAQIKLKAKNSNTQLFADYKGFTSDFVKYNNSNWITHFAPYTQARFFTSVGIGGNTAEMGFNTNNVTNIAFGKLLDTTTVKTRVNVFLPANFTNKNTQCFIVFKNTKTVVQLFTEPILKYFYCLNIPINSQATLVSISKINSDYYLSTASIAATTANPYKLSPVKLSLAQLKEKLKALN